jgi:serine/threonine protein kinase
MLNEMVFRVSDSQLTAVDSWRYILQRHVSYFGDEQGLNGLLEHIGEENPYHERFISIARNTPRQPFGSRESVDQDLRDLLCKMTNLDPTKRITATQALQHRWFMSS